MNDVTKLLQAIEPGLTLYGVLLTFAVFSFIIGKYFWEYEKTLISESVERLKTLLDGYRRRSIEPILTQELAAGVSAAYDNALLGLIGDINSRKALGETGEVKPEPVSDDELKAIVSEEALRKRLDSLKRADQSEAFLASPTGQRLYDELDHAYSGRHDLWQNYARARGACGRAAYSFLILSILLLAGLIRLLKAWPLGLMIVWAIISGEVLAYGFYSFIRLELFRRRLLRLWEEFQIYGKI